MQYRRFYIIILTILLLSVNSWSISGLPITTLTTQQQGTQLGPFDRDRGRYMLQTLKEDIQKNYYDASFRGVDLNSKFKEAEERIKQATSNSQIMGIIAQVVVDFNDSHTLFIPPSRSARIEYGWQMQMIGDKCYIVKVTKDSDAEAKGLKVGDEVEAINGFVPTRDIMWKIEYTYNLIRPQPVVRFEVVSPEGQKRQLDVLTKVTPRKTVLDLTGSDDGIDIMNMVREGENDKSGQHEFYHLGDATIWRMPRFNLADDKVDKAVEIIKKRPAVIIDMRNNPGGYVATLQRLLGSLFDHDIQIGTLKQRKESKPLIAKSRGNKAYTGKIIVLVNSESASCAEIFSRVIQLEKRGTVIGDNTSGKVMISRRYSHKLGSDTVIFYGASITDADLIMSDGKSLEQAGVVPDEKLLPTGAELANHKDRVITRAAELLGITKLSPKQDAGDNLEKDKTDHETPENLD